MRYGGATPQFQGIMQAGDFGLNRERWAAGDTKSDEPPVVFQDDVTVIMLKPKNYREALSGAGKGVYPKVYLKKERGAW